MADLTWTPDGEELFKKLTDAVPEAMREAIKPKLLEMLVARANNNERNSTHKFLLLVCNVQAQSRDESNHDSNLIILRFPSYPVEIRC